MQTNESKRLSFETLFDRGKVRVLFDMTHDAVRVPERAKKASKDGRLLALDYSKRFAMPNFKVDDNGVTAVLTFGGASLSTFVPWEAVVGLAQDGTLMEAWPHEVQSRETFEMQFVIPENDIKWLVKTVAEG